MEENYQDLMNLSADDFENPSSGKTETERYKPTAKEGKDNVYKAVVRFLPWYENPKKSIMSKWTAWLVDPVSGDGKYVDCPSSVGKKSVLQDVYWKLRKSESVAEQDLAKNFSRRQTFASLVQIIKDDNNPELVGKILVFPYGIKIHNKIMAQIKPEFGKPHIPFDLFEGRPFLLNITLVAGYNNYDNCTFLDEKLPITIDGEQLEKSPENIQRIATFLKENSPDLSKYDFREWDDDTMQFVMTVVKNTIPKGKVIESIKSANAKQFANVPDTQTVKSESGATFDMGEAKTVEQEIAPTQSSNVPEIESIKEPEADEFNIDDVNFEENFEDDDLYSKL